MYTDNPIADFNAHDREEQRWLDSRPVCAECGHPIQTEEAYYINGEWICTDCMDSYKKVVDDWYE